MSSNKITLVTVCYRTELRMLIMQARSIAKYVDPLICHSVLVISNDASFTYFRSFFMRFILAEYGSMSVHVRLIDGMKLLKKSRKKKGWVRQQILKLIASKITETDHLLILDTKNHFIRQLHREHIFTKTGQMRINRYAIWEKFRWKFINSCRFFDVIPEEKDFAHALPLSTPYIMDRSAVNQMIKIIEEKSGLLFEVFFITNGPFTEFYLYYSFLLSQKGLVDELYSLHSGMNITFWDPITETEQSFQKKQQETRMDHICSLGIHKRYLNNMTKNTKDQIASLWLEADLIQNEHEADYFFQTPKTRDILVRFFNNIVSI